MGSEQGVKEEEEKLERKKKMYRLVHSVLLHQKFSTGFTALLEILTATVTVHKNPQDALFAFNCNCILNFLPLAIVFPPSHHCLNGGKYNLLYIAISSVTIQSQNSLLIVSKLPLSVSEL